MWQSYCTVGNAGIQNRIAYNQDPKTTPRQTGGVTPLLMHVTIPEELFLLYKADDEEYYLKDLTFFSAPYVIWRDYDRKESNNVEVATANGKIWEYNPETKLMLLVNKQKIVEMTCMFSEFILLYI